MATVQQPAQLVLRFHKNSPLNPALCAHCGEMYQPRKTRRIYCSRSCLAKGINRPKGFTNSTTFKAGHRSWNTGKTGEQSHWYGRSHTPETKALLQAQQQGPNAPNWKGGVSPENERLRKSAQYREWRKAVFERDGYTCRVCGARSKSGQRVRLHADHIQPFAQYPELRFEVTNGRTLCVPCHKATPTYGNGSKMKETATGRDAQLLARHG